MCRFCHIAKLSVLMLLCSMSIQASVVTDTIYSPQRDRVIITYDISHNDNKATIRFIEAKKMLGASNKGKYSKLSEVKVVFFDRVGNYGDMAKFKGKTPKAFTVPAYARYQHSRDGEGYFIVSEEPTITFDVDNGQKPTLNIPIFLAKYEKKGQYSIFSECGPLSIKLGKKKVVASTSNKPSNNRTTSSYETQTITETVTETVDGNNEDAVTPADEATNRIATARELIAQQESLPISSTLSSNIEALRNLEYKVPAAIRSQISQVLAEYEQKKRELEDQAKADEASNQAAAQEAAKKEAQDAAARQDSIAAAEQEKQQQQDEKNKKRNIWMAVGAAILGLLGFGGNQLLQNRRNARSQQSIMDMQQKIVSRAENEAKRRARSIARNKAHQAVNQVKSKGRKAVQENASKLGNAVKGKGNSKTYSIGDSKDNSSGNTSSNGLGNRTGNSLGNRTGNSLGNRTGNSLGNRTGNSLGNRRKGKNYDNEGISI